MAGLTQVVLCSLGCGHHEGAGHWEVCARPTGNQALMITACVGPHAAILHLQQCTFVGSGFCNPDAAP